MNSRPNPIPKPAAFLAILLIIPSLTFLYHWLSGPQVGDWIGYGQIYDNQVDWLSDSGRDPGFLALVSISRRILRLHGYVVFRQALFVLVVTFAVWLATKLPMQKNLPQLSSVLTALVVVILFSLKGFVQIREGLAIMLISMPLVTAYTSRKPAGLLVGLGALAGAAFHAGTGFVFLAWALAFILQFLPDSILAGRRLQRALAIVALLVGIGSAFALLRESNAIRFLLSDSGVDTSAKLRSGAAKTVYWFVNGFLVYEIRREMLSSLQYGQTRFSYCFATIIASVVIPVIYALSATLVFIDFPIPAFTTLGLRLFYTATELGLLIITLKGTATITTLVLAIFMLTDRLRLVIGVG